jgi:hypothetical protein
MDLPGITTPAIRAHLRCPQSNLRRQVALAASDLQDVGLHFGDPVVLADQVGRRKGPWRDVDTQQSWEADLLGLHQDHHCSSPLRLADAIHGAGSESIARTLLSSTRIHAGRTRELHHCLLGCWTDDLKCQVSGELKTEGVIYHILSLR